MDKPIKILFKYPTFKRPEWFKTTLEKYQAMLSGENRCEFLITLNEDDWNMSTPAMKMFMKGFPNLTYIYSPHKNKVAAINADMEGTEFDILFLISDDMIPVAPGFDLIISEHMKKYFPDLDGALHYNDDCCGKDRCITLSIMGKRLYDCFGYIYHPDYASFYCDNEFTDEVRRLGKVQYFPEVIVKHDWQGWGSDRDEVYRRNTQLGKGDEAVYRRRKAAGFPKGKE